MGTVLREWQDQKPVLDYFGAEISKARKGYEGFVKEKEKETLRFVSSKCDLPTLLARIAKQEGVATSSIRSGIRKRSVVRARKLLSQIAVRTMGYTVAEVARHLNISTSAVNRLVSQEELPEIERYKGKLF